MVMKGLGFQIEQPKSQHFTSAHSFVKNALGVYVHLTALPLTAQENNLPILFLKGTLYILPMSFSITELE